MKRRSFLSILGWGGLLAWLATVLGGMVRFAFPNVLFEPGKKVKLTKPEDYPIGSVTFWAEKRLFLFRGKEGFRAMSAICTHLGCTVRDSVKVDNEYPQDHSHCPCHGSVFARDGKVLSGPARRPLESYRVSLPPDGYLQVDKDKQVAADWYFTV
ncbi:MAG: Rieske (2Fe-2S) protein [Thermodesulfobacteriota bacterium]